MKEKNIIILLVSLLVLFVISTMVLTYSFLYVKTDFLSGNAGEKVTEKEIENDVDQGEMVAFKPTELDNAVLYSIPEYDISVNLPNYTLKHELGGTEVKSRWNIGNRSDSIIEFLPNYQSTFTLKFFPEWVPSNVGGGQGVLNENYISIDIYKKGEYKDIEKLKKDYIASVDKLYDLPEEKPEDYPVNGDVVSKWDKEVFEYTRIGLDSHWDGYLVLGDDYIYDIAYYFNGKYPESKAVAQSVLDTISFAF